MEMMAIPRAWAGEGFLWEPQCIKTSADVVFSVMCVHREGREQLGCPGMGQQLSSEPSLIKLISHGVPVLHGWIIQVIKHHSVPLAIYAGLGRENCLVYSSQTGCASRDAGTGLQGPWDRQDMCAGKMRYQRGGVCVYIHIYMAPKNHFTTTFWPQQLCLKSNKRWRNFSTQIIRDPGGDTGLWTLITNAK